MSNLYLPMPAQVTRFAKDMQAEFGGSTYVVGGAPRNVVMGLPVNDYDLVLFTVTEDELRNNTSGWEVDAAGNRFGVFLVYGRGTSFEVALPQVRITDPEGDRMQESAVIVPTLSIKQDAQRRDYTMNAIYVNVLTGEFHEPIPGSVEDIFDKVLRCVNPENYGHDPLRIWRGFRFASEYGLTASQETIEAAYNYRHLLPSLSLDRVRTEWLKWSKGWHPSHGLRFLQSIDALPHSLWELMYTGQDPEYHPEGVVFEHVCQSVDNMLELFTEDDDPEERSVMVFAALLHDIGKPETTVTEDNGRITSRGHAELGADKVDIFFNEIAPKHSMEFIARTVRPLVANHMWRINGGPTTKKAVGKLLRRLGKYATLFQLYQLILTDNLSRGRGWKPIPGEVLDALEIAKEIKAEQGLPPQILMGKHLIAEGYPPGKEMGKLLKAAYAAQLEGEFHDLDGAFNWLSTPLDS